MALATPRWLRSARGRPAAFLAILLLSAGGVLVSGVTPMLLGAVGAATLREGVATAGLPQDGVSVTATAASAADLSTASGVVDETLRDAVAGSDRWGAPQRVVEPLFDGKVTASDGGAPVVAGFSIAEGGCDGVRLAGRCPRNVEEALLSASLARRTGWTTGTRLGTPVPDRGSLAFTVVGVFDDTRGRGRVLADPTVLQQSASARATSDLVLGDADLDRIGIPFSVTGAVRLERPVRQTDLPALRRALDTAERVSVGADGAETATTFRTGLRALLASIAEQQAAGTVLAAPIGAEAALLAWFALAAVAQRTARSRAAEWGVGRMRGARPRAWFAAVFVEPLAAVIGGAVLGLVVAVLVSRAVAALLLGAPDDVDVFAPAVLAATGLALAGSVVALAAASLRAALIPLPELLRDTAEPRLQTRFALVAQVAVASLALAVLWAALSARTLTGGQLGLLLPTMLALLVALAAGRVAVLLVRLATRRPPRGLTGLVAGRGLARAPSALVAGQLVLVSAALAACSLQLGLASATLQTDRAELSTGAAEVLAVRVPTGTSLLSAVRRADPAGRAALAAAELTGDENGGSGRVTAVDVARLDAVSTWRRSWQGVPPARLRATRQQDLVLRGTRVDLRVRDLADGDDLDENGDPLTLPSDAALAVRLVIASPSGWSTVGLGHLRDGTLTGAIPCADGCRVVALGLHSTSVYTEAWGARFTISALSTDRQPAADLRPWLRPDRWRDRVMNETDPTRPSRITTGDTSGDGLQVRAVDRLGSGSPELEPAVGPAVVPVIAASEAPLVDFAGIRQAVLGTSLDGGSMLVRVVGRSSTVPRSLRHGLLADLDTMERASDPGLSVAEQEVWLAPGDHRAVLAALRRAGVQVLHVEHASDAVAAGLRSATHRSLLVAGATAAAGVVFGLLALAAVRVVDMPEQRRAQRALRLAGLPTRRLRRLALVRTAVPPAAGVLLGVATGSVAAGLLTGRLPLLAGEQPGPPLDGAPPLLALAVLGVALVALVAAVAVAIAATEVRRDGP